MPVQFRCSPPFRVAGYLTGCVSNSDHKRLNTCKSGCVTPIPHDGTAVGASGALCRTVPSATALKAKTTRGDRNENKKKNPRGCTRDSNVRRPAGIISASVDRDDGIPSGRDRAGYAAGTRRTGKECLNDMVMLGIISSLAPIIALLAELLHSDEPDSVQEIPV